MNIRVSAASVHFFSPSPRMKSSNLSARVSSVRKYFAHCKASKEEVRPTFLARSTWLRYARMRLQNSRVDVNEVDDKFRLKLVLRK
jgi:hypothetical protein